MNEKSALPAVWNVPQQIRHRLGETAGRQRAMSAEGHLLIILHAPPKPDEEHRTGRYFWRNPEGQWSSSACGGGPHALQRHLQEYADLLEELEKRDMEAHSSAEYFDILSQLTPIQRAARNMHQALQQAREMFPEDRHLINFRDKAYEIERTAELQHADVKGALEFAIALRGEQLADSSYQMSVAAHRLNVLAAFFFPIATLSTVFGMNFVHGYEDAYRPLPFVCVLGLGLLLGFILKVFISGGTRRPQSH